MFDSRSARAAGFVWLLLLAVGAPVSAQQGPRPTRIAVFDSRVLLDSMPERRRAESEFALEQAKARTMLSTVTDSLRLAVDEFARIEQRVSARERELLSLQLRARELMVEEMLARLDETVLRRQQQLREPLAARVREAVRRVRIRTNHDLLLDRASEGLMLDADERLDLTAEILRELRATSPVDQRETRSR